MFRTRAERLTVAAKSLEIASPDDGTIAEVAYQTDRGTMIHGKIEDALTTPHLQDHKGKINLMVTSPPFPLVRKKRYGNETGEAYIQWLEALATPLTDLLTDDGSIVIEIGNAWEEGAPIMSTLPLEALLAFKPAAKLNLCQHVICHNPERLPSPAAWVNLKRARLKDSFTHVWWMSKAQFPKADNRSVLNPYSKDMKKLLARQSYTAGTRPSGHVISKTGFLTDHGGSIGPNVLDLTGEHYPESLLKYTGTGLDAGYRSYCKENDLPAHPARMQSSLTARDYSSNYSVGFVRKELGNVLAEGKPSNSVRQLSAMADQLFAMTEQKGFSAADSASLMKFYAPSEMK